MKRVLTSHMQNYIFESEKNTTYIVPCKKVASTLKGSKRVLVTVSDCVSDVVMSSLKDM
jgi:hypothetical protein